MKQTHSTPKKMTILVINCGSSSLKFSLIDPHNGHAIASGIAERLMSTGATIKLTTTDKKNQSMLFQPVLTSPYDHKIAIALVVKFLSQHQLISNIRAIGHRVVHGGEHYSMPTLINTEVKHIIKKLNQLAPLHNPANLMGIEAVQAAFNDLPQVAVFDTAFHQTMPEKAYLYAIPYTLYQQHSIRKYGFHGTSHYFVSQAAAKVMDKPINECCFISAHLGNGCSITAIKEGKSVDSSMGFTPLDGVMMGTRSGGIDPGIIFHLVENLNYSLDEVNQLMNKKSGLLGISQQSNDCRTLEQIAFNSNFSATQENKQQCRQAKLALTVFCYQIAKSIASFTASLINLDALIFTGGIGENSAWVRAQIITHLSLLNFYIDNEKNSIARAGITTNICRTDARPCYVIPTNEEWVIAEQTYQLLNQE